jgi:hypothetical protein
VSERRPIVLGAQVTFLAEPLLAQRFIGEDVKDDEWRPVCSTRSRHHASKLYLPPPHDKKTRDTGCGPNCWRAERAIDVRLFLPSTWNHLNGSGDIGAHVI